jgi:hypothetical protein
MASGSFEIDTYSWYRSLPLTGCTDAYPTGTMFAVGPCAFLQPYTFYQYQSSVGFTDTSTMSVSFGTFIHSSFASTTSGLESSIYLNRRQYVSTIPLVRWISTNSAGDTVFSSDSPFFYNSTFSSLVEFFGSTIPSSISTTFASTGLFGYITSNIYSGCTPYSLFSTIPVLNSTFFSTLQTSFISSIPSTIAGPVVSSLPGISQPFDFRITSSFTSSAVDSLDEYSINFPRFWVGPHVRELLDSKTYDVVVDVQYSAGLSTNRDALFSFQSNYVWVSTVGIFGNLSLTGSYKGIVSQTRLKNFDYMEIFNRQLFHARDDQDINPVELTGFNSHYRIFFNTIPAISSTNAFYDIYMPGENNLILTLVPK